MNSIEIGKDVMADRGHTVFCIPRSQTGNDVVEIDNYSFERVVPLAELAPEEHGLSAQEGQMAGKSLIPAGTIKELMKLVIAFQPLTRW